MMRPGTYPLAEVVVGYDGQITEVRAGSAALPASGVAAGTYATPSQVRVDALGRIVSITEGASAAAAWQVVTILFMGGNLGGTWYFGRVSGTYGVSPGIVHCVGTSGLIRAGITASYSLDVGETWSVSILRRRSAGESWVTITTKAVAVGAWTATTDAIGVQAGDWLAVGSTMSGGSPADGQLILEWKAA